jgi:hypothetical protein
MVMNRFRRDHEERPCSCLFPQVKAALRATRVFRDTFLPKAARVEKKLTARSAQGERRRIFSA